MEEKHTGEKKRKAKQDKKTRDKKNIKNTEKKLKQKNNRNHTGNYGWKCTKRSHIEK